ncbi:fungal-specific transcription factor domain-containing protein [Bisporella sp. PMI_857]|nr:fungal-specific transcription factor domain-containing protein [Bisporella sp. PMI_857]
MPPQFQFIDSTAGFTDQDEREFQLTLVRSHVMRESRRKQSKAKKNQEGYPHAETRTTTRKSSASVVPYRSRDTESSSITRIRRKTGSPSSFDIHSVKSLNNLPREEQTGLASSAHRGVYDVDATFLPQNLKIPGYGSQNVFGTFSLLPDSGNLQSQILIHHYATVVLPKSMPVSPTPTWLSCAMSDPAMMAAILILSAGHYAAHHGQAGQGLLDMSRGYAISQINRRMSDKSLAINNETVAAVACLAIQECLNGDMEHCRLHLSGLERIIQLRGDNWTDGLDLIIIRILVWLDICDPLDFCGRNRFRWPTAIISPEVLKSSLPPSANIPPPLLVAAAQQRDLSAQIIGSSLFEAFSDMISLTAFISSLSQSPTAARNLDQAMFGDRAFLIELQLSKFSVGQPPPGSVENWAIRQACRFAGLIYVKLVLRGFPVTLKVNGRLSDHIQSSLLNFDFEYFDINTDRGLGSVLLWCLFSGASASTGRTNFTWFINTLARLCKRMGLERWKAVKEPLMSVVWLESDCDVRCKIIWTDVLEKMLSMEDEGGHTVDRLSSMSL